jgi:hypothetical protein
MTDTRSTLRILILDDRPLNALDALESEIQSLFGPLQVERNSTNCSYSQFKLPKGQTKWPNGPDYIFCCSLGSSRQEVVSNLSTPEFREKFHLILIDRDWNSWDDTYLPGDLDCTTWDPNKPENYCGNLFSYLSNHSALTGTVLALFTDHTLSLELIRQLIERGFTTLLKKESGDGSLALLANVLFQADRARRMRAAKGGATFVGLSIRDRLTIALDRWPNSPNFPTILKVFQLLDNGVGADQSIRDLAKGLLAKDIVRDDDLRWAGQTLNSMRGGFEQVGLKIEFSGPTYKLVIADMT